MQWDILTSYESVKSIRPEWEALQARVGRSLFTGYGWLDAWWRFIGQPAGYRLWIVTGRKEGILAAVAAFSLRSKRGIRLLEWAGNSVCDYSDFLLEAPEDAKALWDFTLKHAPCDVAHLKEIHPDALCLPALRSQAKPVRQSEARHLSFRWPTFDAWLASLPYAVRKHYRARVKQAEAIGPLTYELLDDKAVSQEIVQRLVAQKTASLKAHGRRGIFDAPHAADFFYAVAQAEAKNGATHLSTLSCGGQVIATHLGFVFEGRFLSYMPSYDESWSHLSPGRLLMFRCIGWAAENGLKEFDYMRGEDRYKTQFASEARLLEDFMIPRSWRGRLAMTLYRRRN